MILPRSAPPAADPPTIQGTPYVGPGDGPGHLPAGWWWENYGEGWLARCDIGWFGLVVGWLPGLLAAQPILLCRLGRATKHSLELLYHGDLRTVQRDLPLACRLLESAISGRLLPERVPSAPVRGMLLFRSWGKTGDARALVFA